MTDHRPDPHPLGLRVDVAPREISPELLAELVAISRERADAPAVGGWRVAAVAAVVALLLSGGGWLASQQIERDLAPLPAGPVEPRPDAAEPDRSDSPAASGRPLEESRSAHLRAERDSSDGSATPTVQTDPGDGRADEGDRGARRGGRSDSGDRDRDTDTDTDPGEDGDTRTGRDPDPDKDMGRDPGKDTGPAHGPPAITTPPVVTPPPISPAGPSADRTSSDAQAGPPDCARATRDACPAGNAGELR